jgi:hypothetical protein
LAQLQPHALPPHGARAISLDANAILQKVWKSKSIPPFLKTFAWRLIRRVVATAERAGHFSNNININCSHCGAIENDNHLFFLCDVPALIWTSVDYSLPIHLLDINEDGIQTALPLFFSTNLTDEKLSEVRYIWKARNDNRFHRKIWTPFQVLMAATTHRTNYLEATMQTGDTNENQISLQQTNLSTSSPLHCRNESDNPNIANTPHFLCYTDALTIPDNIPFPRRAGLGIHIIDLQVQPANHIHIRASLREIHFVDSAEAAAMALAAVVLHKMNSNSVVFYSNCATLVDILNSRNSASLPNWRMKFYTQIFDDYTKGRRPQIVKLDRKMNCIADNLAKLAFESSAVQLHNYVPVCTSVHHVHQCPMLDALPSVTLGQTRILAASCC